MHLNDFGAILDQAYPGFEFLVPHLRGLLIRRAECRYRTIYKHRIVDDSKTKMQLAFRLGFRFQRSKRV